MRKVGIGALLAAVFAGGVLIGAWQLQNTKTLVVISTVTPRPTLHAMHVVMTDDQPRLEDGSTVPDGECAKDLNLPSIGEVEVRAPGNGLTVGQLLGVPDQVAVDWYSTEHGQCQLDFNVPDLLDSAFYVITTRRRHWTLSRGALQRRKWEAVLDATPSRR